MKFFSMLGATALVTFSATGTNAAITVNIRGLGNNVVATTTGSLDLTGLTLGANTYYLQTAVAGSTGYIGTGAGSHNVSTDPFTLLSAYTGLTGPASFGSGRFTNADSGSSNAFGLNASSFGSPYIFVPLGYLSGTSLVSRATFLNQTIATLGLTAGSYIYDSGIDNVTVNIAGIGAVPTSPVPAKGASDAQVPTDEELAKVRLGPRQRPQSLQSGTPRLW
ncbi:hypothetical protein SPAN111604_07820 [Sphingomonas antarctica]|uniref:hypothetical protein n=1 Tax=Sphingomonas antarctica TaxID=2040274 RepID=UPI0039E926B6